MVGGAKSDEVGVWLLENAHRMTEAMFFDPKIDWSELEPIDILAMRACAPAGVFTEVAKGAFLTRIEHSELGELANALFYQDEPFIILLPPSVTEYRPMLIQLVQLAYRKGIRPSDSVVRRM